MAVLLILAGKCSSGWAKSAHVGSHLPAAGRSDFMASKLAAYQQAHGLDDVALAEQLGCTLDNLTHLRLCGLPHPAGNGQDVERIATHVHAQVDVLQMILEEE